MFGGATVVDSITVMTLSEFGVFENVNREVALAASSESGYLWMEFGLWNGDWSRPLSCNWETMFVSEITHDEEQGEDLSINRWPLLLEQIGVQLSEGLIFYKTLTHSDVSLIDWRGFFVSIQDNNWRHLSFWFCLLHCACREIRYFENLIWSIYFK